MSPTSNRSAVGRTAAFTAAALFAVVALALVWFFSGDAPDEVELDRTVAGIDLETSGDGSVDAVTDGTWTVRTDVEPFSFEASTGTFVGFRIDEELAAVGATEAVGRMPAVTGALTLDGDTVTAASFTAEVASLTTDDTRRDRRARAAIGGETVGFTLTEPIVLASAPVPGTTFTATAVGELTVNGTTRSVEVPLSAALPDPGLLVVTASFDVLLSDHGVSAPAAPIVLSVSDTATVEVQLLLTSG